MTYVTLKNGVSAVSLYVDETRVTVRADSIEPMMRKLNNAMMLLKYCSKIGKLR